MGGISFGAREFGGILSESAGYKSGLALSEDQLREFLHEGDFGNLWPEGDGTMRIRSEEYEEIHWYILHRLGIASSHFEPFPVSAVFRRVKDDPLRAAIFEPVAEAFAAFLKAQKLEVGRMIDPKAYIDAMSAEYGPAGGLVALDLVQASAAVLRNNPWNPTRRREWEDVRDLDELFKSEQLESPHGNFFDQRFANFLGVNFDAIDNIHWRQFEGLAAEYFEREGFSVELGPGRGDGGVDIRLWPNDETRDNAPAAVLVQCKRQRTKIASTVVKALWADVTAEKAGGGLIVTTSVLSPSADAVRTVRDYDIQDAQRETLKSWVERLREPGTGVILAE